MPNHQQQRKRQTNTKQTAKDGLDLTGQIWQEVDRILSLPQYHNIRVLTVNNSSLATIPLLPHGIEILDLSRNHIERIQGLNNLTFLKTLQLSHNEIRRIEGLSKNYQLQHLCMSHNIIREIENISHLQLLHTLDLRFNHLSHLDVLKRLEDNLNLRTLDVDGNEFAIRISNFHLCIFQMLNFLQIVDGKSIEDAMSNKHNKRNKNGNRRLKIITNKDLKKKISAKPRYMTSTISAKLKNGYEDQRISRKQRKQKLHNRGSYAFHYEEHNSKKNTPSAWTNFNHYSMKAQAKKRMAAEQQSIYDYATPKMKGAPLEEIQKDSGAGDSDSNSSIPAIPIATKQNVSDAKVNKTQKRSNDAKTRMKDVIKKLNEKINKLYSWHLVEIDLVSKQLNEIRTELTSTRQSLSSYVSNGSMVNTPLRLLATPQSAMSLDGLSDSNGGIKADANSDGQSSMTIRSQIDLKNPDFIKRTLQKCYQILKRDNATATELEAVENLVHQLESDMAANAQLESLQIKQLQESVEDMNAAKEQNDKREQNLKLIECDETNLEQEDSASMDIRSETNSMIKQFNSYNDEINKLEKELKAIDVSAQSSEITNAQRNDSKGTLRLSLDVAEEVEEVEDEKESTISVDTENLNPVNVMHIEQELSEKDMNAMDDWLAELADELNTAKLSLKHLMDISSETTENRIAKVKEFNVVASKCDMFTSFELTVVIGDIMNKLSLNTQIGVQNYLHELQLTKDSIQKLIVYIIQEKEEDLIQRQRNKIVKKKLTKTASYNLSMNVISSTKHSRCH